LEDIIHILALYIMPVYDVKRPEMKGAKNIFKGNLGYRGD
jgi:hypothetical protein